MRALADRYADALADVALSQNAGPEVRRELGEFVALLRGAPQLRVLLDNPAVSRTDKHKVVEALVARMGASRTLRNFLLVVLDRRRITLLQQIQEALESRLDERQGIRRASVTSARELTAEEKGQLTTVLAQLTGSRVESSYALDPALIAGTVVRIGSTIYDGSVRAQLERLRARLASQ